MIDPAVRQLWLYRALFVGLAAALMFAKLLPLGAAAGAWPGPDILLCVLFAWVMRRPDTLPVLLITAVILAEDLILMRPPGLWAAIVVVASEFLRSRVALTRELTFVVEWMLVAGLMLAMVLAYRLAHMIAFVGQPALGFQLIQTFWTILCYPAVVGALRLGLAFHKPAQGEIDSRGRRL